MNAKQAVIDVKYTGTRSVRADRAFAKSRHDKLSTQVKHLKITNNVEKMQLASSLTSANLGVLKTWSEDQAKHNPNRRSWLLVGLLQIQRKKMETSKEEYIVAMYFLSNITQSDAGILWPKQETDTKL